MKNLLTYFLMLSPIYSYCQTKVIAYKSHSGNMAYFSPLEGPDNIGNPPEMMENLRINPHFYPSLDTMIWTGIKQDSVIKLSDSLIIFIPFDTIYAHETLTDDELFGGQELSIDSIQRLHPEIIYIGFDLIDKKSLAKDSVKNKSSSNSQSKKNNIFPIVSQSDNIGNNHPESSTNIGKQSDIMFLILSLLGLIFMLFFINLSQSKSKRYI